MSSAATAPSASPRESSSASTEPSASVSAARYSVTDVMPPSLPTRREGNDEFTCLWHNGGMTVNVIPMQPDEAKVELRASIRRQRQQRAERRLAEHAQALCERVLALDEIRSARCVSVYASRPHEPGTLPLIEALHM